MTIKQDISNLPQLDIVNREVEVVGLTLDLENRRIEFFYRINHIVNGEVKNEVFTSATPPWKIDNSYTVLQRNKKLQPIPNPDFEEQTDEEGNILNESERYLKAPAFDYFVGTQIKPMLEPILKAYIQMDDQKGKYNL